MDVLKTGAQQSSSEKGRDTAAAEKDAAEKAAAEEKAATERRWKVSPEARLLFGSTFETTVGVDGTRMQRDRAMRHILRSGVAQTTVEDILRVVAPSGGRLDEGQFVIAMLLASRLAEGIPMPTPLPEELAQALAGRDEPPPAYNPEHNWDSNSPPKEAQLHEFFPVEGSGISAIAPLRSNDRPLTERAQPSAAIHAKENRDVNSERPVYWEHTQLRVAHEALHEAQMQLITRQHEASDVSLRIAAVQAQRKAVQEEYAECVSRLRVVRGQCMEYSAQLETRRRELQAEQRELARAAADVKDSQTKAEAYLSEAQTLAHSLQVARDELRRLKHSHTSQLRAAHLSSRQLAPERSELAQVRAEIGVLKQQVEQADLMEMTAADASIMAASSAELKAALEEARLERQMLQDELQRERHERRQLEESAADVQTLTVMQDQLDRTHAEAEQIQAELQHLRMVAFAAVGTMEGASKASTKEAAFSPVASVIASEAPPFVADAASFDAEASAACTSTFDAEASSVNANNLSFGADNSMFGAGDSTFDTDFSAFDATASNGGADSSTFGAEALGFGAEASAFGTENSLFGEHTSAFDAGSAFGSTDAAGFGSTDASGFGTADAVTLGAEAPASGAELSAFGIGNEASTFDTDFSAFEVVEPAFGTETSDFPDEALAFPAAGFGTENSAFEADASAFGADAFGAGASEFDAGASGFGVDASGFGTDGSGFETSASAFGADTPAFGEEASAFGTTFDTFGDQASTFGVTADGFGNEGSLFETDGVSAFDADASSFGNEAFGETSQVATTHDGFGSTNDFGDGFSVEFADDGFGREGFEAPLTSAAALPQEAPPDNGFPMSATATSQDVLEMAEFLEMKVDEDPDLLWIARAALEGDDSLPDDHFKELYRKHREMKKLQQKVVFGSGPLGLELTQKGDQVVVTKVLPDTQAFFHHVQEGATIVAVNDIPMNGMSRDAVLQQIRIAPRPVQLTFMNSSKSAMQGSGGKARDVPTTRWPEQTKALGEMGFTDAATVSMVLDETGGDVDAALTRLFQMG
ncbi:hypothetical protein AB1Y20_013790 [Prymnesium parvum]|uniref:PDZ domain-containing protein n=1 Tax=Prymnesium parvum TaxID=97485 RepID=A0AB34IEL0_PRYPA